MAGGPFAAPRRRRTFGLVLVAVLAAAVAILVGAERDPGPRPVPDPSSPEVPGPPSYANPLVDGVSRNPSVMRVDDGTYYAYVDGIDMGGPIPVVALRSPDLGTWTMVGGVLADPGGWADPSLGHRFTSPSVRHVPTNPPPSRYVMYLTGPAVDGSASCIGVATAPDPAGPFVGADQPLICPPGGARAASPVPGSDQVVFRAETPTPGIYGLTLDARGTAVAPGSAPSLLLGVADGVTQEGTLERPAVARDAEGGTYLFARTGGGDGGVGWSRCRTAGTEVTTCADRTHFGPWLAPRGEVAGIGGLQVFTDGEGAAWIAYDAQAAEGCTGDGCTGIATLRLDRLCFAHGQPRTDGPSTGTRAVDRTADCSTDVPGVALDVATVDGTELLDQPPGVTLHEGASAVPVGGRLLWLFDETYIDPATAGPDGFCRGRGGSRANSAGLGLPHPLARHRGYASPLGLGGPEGRCTLDFIPLLEDETFFNMARSDVGRRVALWQSGAIPLDDGSALVFFLKGLQDRDADGADGDDAGPDPGCRFCIDGGLAQGVVRVSAGQAVADRASTAVACAPSCLFGPDEPGWSGLPFVDDGFVYAHSATPESPAIRLGRVPIADVLDRSAWTFRTEGGTWSDEVADAAAVPALSVAPATVAYNAHLDRFVAVVQVTGNVVALQTAPAPWGPWSEPTPVYDWSGVECDGTDADGRAVKIDALAPTAVPWLDEGGGRIIRFVFSRPGPNFGRDPFCPGEMRMVSVALT